MSRAGGSAAKAGCSIVGYSKFTVNRPSGANTHTCCGQLRGKRDPEVVVAGVFRLAMRDGSPILVTGTSGAIARLLTVLPPDWQIGDPVLWQRDPNHVRHAPKRKPTLPRVEDASPPALASQPVPAAATNNSELAAKILASKS